MELYVELDVPLKETSICVVDGAGEIVCEGAVLSEPEAIAVFVKTKAPHVKRIGLETGPTSTWIWHELRALGLPVNSLGQKLPNLGIACDVRDRG